MEIDGPIPGENFTSDTKNYPWHRPPEFTEVDPAIEMTIKRLTKKKAAFGILTMLETGASVAAVTDMYLTSGIGAGKWSTDLSLLLAGPTARIIKLMADGYGIEYQMGIEDDEYVPTKAFFDGMTSVTEQEAGEVGGDILEAEQKTEIPKTGFMAPSDSDEQVSMLGYGEEEEVI